MKKLIYLLFALSLAVSPDALVQASSCGTGDEEDGGDMTSQSYKCSETEEDGEDDSKESPKIIAETGDEEETREDDAC